MSEPMASSGTPAERRATAPGRRSPRHPWLVASGVTVVLLAVALAFAPRLLDRRSVSTVTVAGPVTRIELDIEQGDVKLVPGTGTDVVVERTLTWRVGRPLVGTDPDGSTLRITATCPSSVPLIERCWTSHRIEVPVGVDVEVRTGAGSVTAVGLDGWLHLVTARGRVTGEDLEVADLLAETHGGPISVVFSEPPSRVVLASGGGDVDVAMPGGPYDLDVSAAGGELTVAVDTERLAEAMITVASDGGSVTIVRP
jgi:hypothetical protein